VIVIVIVILTATVNAAVLLWRHVVPTCLPC